MDELSNLNQTPVVHLLLPVEVSKQITISTRNEREISLEEVNEMKTGKA